MNARRLVWLSLLVGGCSLADALGGVDEVGSTIATAPRSPLPAVGDIPGGPGDEAPLPEPTFALASEVAHSYLPMRPGMVWVYEGHDLLRFRRDVLRVLATKRLIHGVACTGVMQEVTLDGVLAERTTLWYAQDDAGGVWQFGEESIDFTEGPAKLTADSWEAGVGGDLPWLYIGADPLPGNIFGGEHVGHPERIVVSAVGVLAEVPAGVFGDCLEVVETNPDDPDDEDLIIYAPDVGMVSERSNSGSIELVSFTQE